MINKQHLSNSVLHLQILQFPVIELLVMKIMFGATCVTSAMVGATRTLTTHLSIDGVSQVLNPSFPITWPYTLSSVVIFGIVVIPFLAVAFRILHKHCSLGKENCLGEYVSFRWRERRQFEALNEDTQIANDLCPMCRAPMGELRTAYITAECMICLEEVDKILISECGHSICKVCASVIPADTADGQSEEQAPKNSQASQHHNSKIDPEDDNKMRFRDEDEDQIQSNLSRSKSAVPSEMFSERCVNG